MSISSTAAVVTSTGPNTYSMTATSANTLYVGTQALSVGIYTVSCVSSTVARVDFFNGTTLIGTATTVSGSVTYNLATAATKVYVSTNTGSNIVVSIALTGSSLAGAPSGTLDTITTTTNNYAINGTVYAIVVGGGGPGGKLSGQFGGGGGAGGVAYGVINLTSPTVVTIGAGGSPDTAGGASSIGNLLTANGGGASGNGGSAGTAGTPTGFSNGGGGSSNNVGGAGGNVLTPLGFVYANQIGTGGSGATGGASQSGNSGTGYGSGGGGAATGGGGSGASGVVYILRGI